MYLIFFFPSYRLGNKFGSGNFSTNSFLSWRLILFPDTSWNNSHDSYFSSPSSWMVLSLCDKFTSSRDVIRILAVGHSSSKVSMKLANLLESASVSMLSKKKMKFSSVLRIASSIFENFVSSGSFPFSVS